MLIYATCRMLNLSYFVLVVQLWRQMSQFRCHNFLLPARGRNSVTHQFGFLTEPKNTDFQLRDPKNILCSVHCNFEAIIFN